MLSFQWLKRENKKRFEKADGWDELSAKCSFTSCWVGGEERPLLPEQGCQIFHTALPNEFLVEGDAGFEVVLTWKTVLPIQRKPCGKNGSGFV